MRRRWMRAAIWCAFLSITVPLMAQPSPTPQRADAILILKRDHVLESLKNGKVFRTYKVALARAASRQKSARAMDARRKATTSSTAATLRAATIRRCTSLIRMQKIANAMPVLGSPGGAVMIHGLPNGKGWIGAGHRLYDWTLGCIAVTDAEIDEIWEMVPVGTPVEIRP